MNSNSQAIREIKDNLGRGKSYLNKQEPLKGISSICEALKLYMQNKLFGKDKIEIEYLIVEVVQIICQIQILQSYIPSDFEYTRGQEKKLYNDLVGIIRCVAENLQKESSENQEQDLEVQKNKLLEKMQSQLMSGKKMHASSHAKKLLEEYGDTADMYSHIANTYYQANMYREALTYIKKALNKDPNNIKSYRTAINSLRKLKEYEKAENIFQQALKKFGEHPNIYMNMARMYWEWEKPEEAQSTAEKAVALDPDNQEVQQVLSEIKQWRESKSQKD